MTQEAGKSTIDNYEPFGPEWEAELMKLPKKFIINMIREIKTNPKFQQREQPWVRVSDRLPENEENVLFFQGYMYIGFYHTKINQWCYDDSVDSEGYAKGVTHWMPLPAPPKD